MVSYLFIHVHFHMRMLIHAIYLEMVSFQCEFACGFPNLNYKKMLIHIFLKKMDSLQHGLAFAVKDENSHKNADPYNPLENCFIPLSVNRWAFKQEWSENTDQQRLQNIISILCVCAYDVLNENTVKMLIHTLHKNMVSPQCVFACDFSNMNYIKMLIHTLHRKMVFFHCV